MRILKVELSIRHVLHLVKRIIPQYQYIIIYLVPEIDGSSLLVGTAELPHLPIVVAKSFGIESSLLVTEHVFLHRCQLQLL